MGIFQIKKNREKAYPEKEEEAKPETAEDIPGEHYGSDIKESPPSTAQAIGTP